jgi:hypothetical protein
MFFYALLTNKIQSERGVFIEQLFSMAETSFVDVAQASVLFAQNFANAL